MLLFCFCLMLKHIEIIMKIAVNNIDEMYINHIIWNKKTTIIGIDVDKVVSRILCTFIKQGNEDILCICFEGFGSVLNGRNQILCEPSL